MELAPIVLFTYDRLTHTQKAIEALLQNPQAKESELIIFSDGPKLVGSQEKVTVVRTYLRTITGFKNITIHERDRNYGLATNIIEGVTEVVNKYGCIIVLEDDLIVAPFFLTYMNEGLTKYQHEEEVISIVGYTYPTKYSLPETFFLKGSDCLGWATWKRGWDLFERDANKLWSLLMERGLSREFDFNGTYPYTRMLADQISNKVNSWAIRWYASAFLNDKLTLYPGKSLVVHLGNDGSGTNYTKDSILDVEISSAHVVMRNIPIVENKIARKAFVHFFRSNFRPSLLRRIKIKIGALIKNIRRNGI